jgi:DNA-binding response OmpR family regulator
MTTGSTAPLLLYVEDEILIQQMLVTDLEEAGFEVLVSSSGPEAMELLSSRAHEIHGLITDINLGGDPNGWDIARKARELRSGLPVIYVSAASDQEWTSQGVPASVMIAKPFVPAQVVVAISTLLIVTS